MNMPYPYITSVNICADIPITADGVDQFYFSGQDSLTTAILSKSLYSYSNLSYQRIKNSVPGGKPAYTIILPVNCDTLLAQNCNYITFKNQSLERSRIFAFIIDIGYNGENSSTITYEIDYFTTYIQSAVIKKGFVEREHVLDDTPGSNTEPEPITIDYYTEASQNILPLFTSVGLVNIYIFVTDNGHLPSSLPLISSPICNGEFTGLQCAYYNNASTALQAIHDIINQAGPDAIRCIMQSGGAIPQSNSPSSENINKGNIYPNTNLHNKKLLTYPFRYFKLCSTTGGSIKLLPQKFTSQTIQLTNAIIGFSNPEQVVRIANGTYTAPNSELMLSRPLYNSCSYTEYIYGDKIVADAFLSSLRSLGGILSSVKNSNMLGAFGGILPPINSLSDIYFMQPGSGGNTGTNLFNSLYGEVNFVTVTCNENRLKVIDNYFDAYGYAVNRIKMPELNSRPNWNYVKTSDITISGNIPTQAKEIIKSKFDRGVRLWHTIDVGNYELSNTL